jgi:DNA polymerase-3 subunit delta'
MAHTWPVFGHDWAVDHLRKCLINGRARHAYLLAGTGSIGKTALAHAFAMALNCGVEDIAERPCGRCRSCRLIQSGNHPDILYSETDPATGALKIEAIRDVTSRLALRPLDGRYRVAILPDFDRAAPRAQDAILKTLEEPPPYAVMILLATSLEAILPTITSRAQVLHLRPIDSRLATGILMDRYGMEADKAGLLARISGGRIGWAIRTIDDPALLQQRDQALDLLEEAIRQNRAGRFKLAEDLGKDKPSLRLLLDLWLTFWRDLLLLAEKSMVKPCNSDRLPALERLLYTVGPQEALRAVRATQTLIDNLSTNVNTRLAVEVMFLDYPGLPG